MTRRILISKPNFYDWLPYFEIIVKTFPSNIFMFDFSKNDINHLINLYNIDAILAITLDDIEIISKIKPKCLILNNINIDIINICNDKCKFAEYMIKNNFGHMIPETYISKYKNHTIHFNKLKYPAILKKNISHAGKDIFILKTEEEMLQINLKYEYIIQEYIIEKNEFNAHLFCFKGKIYYYLFNTFSVDNKFYILKGSITNYSLVDIEIKYFEELIRKMNFTGPLNINFKIEDYKIKILEINPRFGGSFVYSCFLQDLFYFLIIKDFEN